MFEMSSEKFEELLYARLDKIEKVLSQKAAEYSHKDDRLYNFNVAAKMNSTTPAKALWGMATKHLVSVQDLVNGNLKNTVANVNEKITDMINYLILLEAVLKVERDIECYTALEEQVTEQLAKNWCNG